MSLTNEEIYAELERLDSAIAVAKEELRILEMSQEEVAEEARKQANSLLISSLKN